MKIWLTSPGSLVNRGLLVGLGALALAAFLVGNHSYASKSEQQAGVQSSVPSATIHPGEDFYYFRSGQWLADLRTAVAVCRYLADPGLA